MKKIAVHGSSLISDIEYSTVDDELTIYFKKYYTDKLTYIGVTQDILSDFLSAKSLGSFYLKQIKPKFSLKKQEKFMSEFTAIRVKIDTRKIKKEWLFVGEKGVYLNLTLLFRDKPDQYGNRGPVIQDVPTEIYKKDRSIKGPILGNCMIFELAPPSEEEKPGSENGTRIVTEEDKALDD